MIDAKRVCFCGHLADKHLLKTLWSNATESWHATDKCRVGACRCKHFERTTFTSVAGTFEETEVKNMTPDVIQLEMFE